jgi:hypothetical protein
MKEFYLMRIEDESGISGTGIVAVVAMLPSGRCVLEWLGDEKTITMFESIEQIKRIHGHNGKTLVYTGSPLEVEKSNEV